MTRAKRTKNSAPDATQSDVDTALAALSEDDLREFVRATLAELSEVDAVAHSRVITALIQRATRGSSGWTPAKLSDEEVEEAVAFAEDAARAGHAEPSDVDDYLRRASGAFFRKDYASAQRIFEALLPRIADAVIDLGQETIVDDVLGTDPTECAVQYVVSVYLTSSAAERAQAVLAAIETVRGIGYFREPIREMERTAVEPLRDLENFLPRWRALLTKKLAGKKRRDEIATEDEWLREVVQRLEGSDGLAQVARSTRRADDLRAWCESLVENRDWQAALTAYEEAAELVADKQFVRGALLDGAALASQELGHRDLPARLERAWREEPSMLRLRRWLGTAEKKKALHACAATALDACPKNATRQRGFLQLLLGDFASAAKLLAAAPGLGWSDDEHPGHLLFPRFVRLLGGKRKPTSTRGVVDAHRERNFDERIDAMMEPDKPRLPAPEVDELISRAGINAIRGAAERSAVLDGLKRAAEKRIAGVTAQKRRGYYSHAAELVSACAMCDPTSETAAWFAALRQEHRRFPALRAAFDRVLKR